MDSLRRHVIELLKGKGAHISPEEAVASLAPELRGTRPESAPHTAWQLLEHMRIAQWDILEFTRNPRHKSPPWPEGYWPDTEAPPNAHAWDDSVRQFGQDLAAMQQLVADPASDLLSPIPHGDGQTILREALVLADHNSYHLGQLVFVGKLLGAWPG